MKRFLLLIFFATDVLFCQDSTAVNSPPDSINVPDPWKHGMVAGLTMTQIAFKDWAQGGENALSYTVALNGKSRREDSTTSWINTYKFAFGQTRLGIRGLRKTDDKIDLESVLSYKIRAFVDPYASLTLKTQFALGFTYDQKTDTKTAVSKFFDPAYLTQTIGFGYQPAPEIRTRLGAGLREVITSSFTAYADNPNTPVVEKIKIDGGLESVTNIDLELDDNILLTSKLELFAAFDALDEVIIRSDNTLAAKINKIVSVILTVQIINDLRITPKTQVKEALSLGVSYTLL